MAFWNRKKESPVIISETNVPVAPKATVPTKRIVQEPPELESFTKVGQKTEPRKTVPKPANTSATSADASSQQNQKLPPTSASIKVNRTMPIVDSGMGSTIKGTLKPDEPVVPPPPEKLPLTKDAAEVDVPSLRTYKDDIQDAVQGQKMTSATILMAEQKRQDEEQKESENQSIKKPRNILFLFLSIILIAGGVGVGGYLIYTALQPGPMALPRGIDIDRPSFVDTDVQKEIIFEGRQRNVVLNELRSVIAGEVKPEAIVEIALTKKLEVTTADGKIEIKKATISTTELMELLETHAPDALVRSFDPNFMLGFQGKTKEVGAASMSNTSNAPFIVFRVDDYDKAFAGMLEWENLMANDLRHVFSIFAPEPIQRVVVATSTATSTPVITNFSSGKVATSTATSTIPKLALGQATTTATSTISTASTTAELEAATTASPKYFKRDVFVDRVISNHDTRAIRANDGTLIFFYSFIDDRTLVLTTNKITFEEILDRMRTAQLIR